LGTRLEVNGGESVSCQTSPSSFPLPFFGFLPALPLPSFTDIILIHFEIFSLELFKSFQQLAEKVILFVLGTPGFSQTGDCVLY
jgi:hypothetical protein